MLKVTNDMEEVIKAENAVIYFTAEWCAPCKQLKPQYAKAAVIDADTTYFMVDVDAIGSQYLLKYGIQSIPQVYEINNGTIGKKITGKTSDAILAEMGKTNAA